jgi:hypothetical protein
MDWIGLADDTFQCLAVITTARIIQFLWRHGICWPDEILSLSRKELCCLGLLTSGIICELGDEYNNESEAFFAMLRKATMSIVTSVLPSVYPHGTTWFPLDGFSWNLAFEDCSKICRENSSSIKIRQEWRLLYTKTFAHSWYLTEIFLVGAVFRKNCIKK